ncbi:ubiquinol-cytochrome c reductase iron-sulfur subunit [Enemella sp. A6]|uniref:QcrA and Rieske domain-containing protein n=1 Tax=Enemella sp. A6 TaxID=3440152 RepID=UPI003EB9D6F7
MIAKPENEETADLIDTADTEVGVDRRTLLKGVGVTALVGAAGVGLSACTEPRDTGRPDEGPTETVNAADVPVGSGRIFENYVVTQPTEGEFKGFSAVCPHQFCKVTVVKQTNIVCQCHGSEFDINDGAVTAGPALEPLPSAPVTVKGDTIEVGGN